MSIVTIPDANGAPMFRVTQDYHPSSATPNLYEDTVTIENIAGVDLDDLRYRRVMDWDVEPTAFSEYSTIDGSSTDALLFSSDDGFASANPLAGPSRSTRPAPVTSSPTTVPMTTARFRLRVRRAADRSDKAFNVYYGGAGTEADANTAVASVGAEVWSYGQPSSSDPAVGTPNTFVFAFSGVGGSSFAGSDPRPPIALSVFGPGLLEGSGAFDVTARVHNVGDGDSTDVSSSIVLGDGLTFAPSETGAFDFGPLASTQTLDHDFHVVAPTPTCLDQTFHYDVFATYAEKPSDESDRHVGPRTVVVPGTCSHLTGQVTAYSAGLEGATITICPVGSVECVTTTTDALGNYSAALPDGDYDVTASHDPDTSTDPDTTYPGIGRSGDDRRRTRPRISTCG